MKRELGSALVLWKVTRRNAKVSRTRRVERFWRAAAETNLSGYGKVRNACLDYSGFLTFLPQYYQMPTLSVWEC